MVHAAMPSRLASTTWPSPVRSARRSAARIPATSARPAVWSPWAGRGWGATPSGLGHRVGDRSPAEERGDVVAGPLGIGPGRAVAGERGVDEPGVARASSVGGIQAVALLAVGQQVATGTRRRRPRGAGRARRPPAGRGRWPPTACPGCRPGTTSRGVAHPSRASVARTCRAPGRRASGSTFTTSAPRSARTAPALDDAIQLDSSTTRTSLNGAVTSPSSPGVHIPSMHPRQPAGRRRSSAPERAPIGQNRRMVLRREEARVLACLIEKDVEDPDGYPVGLNALRLACNQTTDRWPVVTYDDRTVEGALFSLKSMGLVRFVEPADDRKVALYRHAGDDRWRLSKSELAVLAVLVLRGPQTVEEVEGAPRPARCRRWHRGGHPRHPHRPQPRAVRHPTATPAVRAGHPVRPPALGRGRGQRRAAT